MNSVHPSVSLFVCLSVPCFRFSPKKKPVEISNLVDTQRWTGTRATTRANLRSKGERSRSLETKMYKSFSRTSSSKLINLRRTKNKLIIGPFYTNTSDIKTDISERHQRKCFVFCDNDCVICNLQLSAAACRSGQVAVCLLVSRIFHSGNSNHCNLVLHNPGPSYMVIVFLLFIVLFCVCSSC